MSCNVCNNTRCNGCFHPLWVDGAVNYKQKKQDDEDSHVLSDSGNENNNKE